MSSLLPFACLGSLLLPAFGQQIVLSLNNIIQLWEALMSTLLLFAYLTFNKKTFEIE